MHIGDPRFAAQVQTREGNVHDFDDPGCLYRWLDRAEPDVHAVWLRHADRDGWIDAREAAFVEREPTPMGYGLGAVPRGTPGSFDDAEARRRVRARHRHRRHEP
jgi:hypothetical protein